LSFVDPDIPGLAEEPRIDRDDALVWRIAELARKDAKVEARLRELSERDLPPLKRRLLSRVLSRIQTAEALMATHADCGRSDRSNRSRSGRHQRGQPRLFI